MKRPFAVVGFTGFAVLLFLAFSDSDAVAYCVFFACTSIGVLTLLKKNLRQAMTVPVGLFTAAIACLLFVNFNLQKQTVQGLIGDSLSVNAIVAEAPYVKRENGRHYCVLKLRTVDGKKAKGRLRLSFSPGNDGIDEELLEIGNSVSFTGKVYVPGEAEKSISRYFTGENILLGAYAARDVSISQETRRSVSYYFCKLRDFVSEKLRYCFGDKIAGLLIGVLTGDKDCLDPELYNALRRTGTAHLMAVSGLHLSMWVFILGSLIPEKRKTAKLRCLLLMSAVIFIMLLAGMSESVKRAGFMSLVFLCGKLSGRDSDSLNSLGFAVTVMLIYNPASVLSISLQLSFLSTLGILTLGKYCLELSAMIFGGKRINTPLRKLLRSVSDMFFISISVLVFTLPVLVYSFGGFSAVTVWVNMLISPVVAPLLILAGACVLLAGLPFASYPVMLLVKLLSDYVVLITSFFSGVKNAFVVFEKENAFLLLAAAVIVICVCAVILHSDFTGRSAAVTASVMLAAVLILSGRLISDEGIKIRLAAYDDTFAVAVEKDKKAALLCDTDEYEKGLFVSVLEEKGVDVFCELVDPGEFKLKSLSDGKYITDEKSRQFFDGFNSNHSTGEKILEIDGKYIHIFYGEALQYENCCDIIIQMLADDITVSTSDNRLSLKKEKIIEIDV